MDRDGGCSDRPRRSPGPPVPAGSRFVARSEPHQPVHGQWQDRQNAVHRHREASVRASVRVAFSGWPNGSGLPAVPTRPLGSRRGGYEGGRRQSRKYQTPTTIGTITTGPTPVTITIGLADIAATTISATPPQDGQNRQRQHPPRRAGRFPEAHAGQLRRQVGVLILEQALDVLQDVPLSGREGHDDLRGLETGPDGTVSEGVPPRCSARPACAIRAHTHLANR